MAQRKKAGVSPKTIKWIWGVVFAPFALLAVMLLLTALGLFGRMPSFEELENPRSNLATEIYSEDGKVIGSFFVQNRSYVQYEDLFPADSAFHIRLDGHDMPPIVAALIATEDARFRTHSGIDIPSLARVAVKTVLLQNTSQGGGSTITQQLAKNLFPRDTVRNRGRIVRSSKLVVSKLKEWITALKLEYNYTKEEIAAMYLNTVEYGSNAYGIKSAAQTFFNKEPHELNVQDAAVLVGVVNAPTRYSPVRNPENALARRNLVLSRMEDAGALTRKERDSISALPIVLNYKPVSHNEGTATYFREMLRLVMNAERPKRNQFYTEWDYDQAVKEYEENPLYGWCRKNRKADGTPYNIYRDGLKIYTTVNSTMQKYAEQAVQKQMQSVIQPRMDAQYRNTKTLFIDATREERERIMRHAIRYSDRYREMEDAGSERTAYTMLTMLQDVVNSGTAGRLKWQFGLNDMEIGGKTGTSNKNRDAWFMCVAPKLVAGAWVGGEDQAVHFVAGGEGSVMALPIVGDFMKRVYDDGRLGVSRADQFIRPAMMPRYDCDEEVDPDERPTEPGIAEDDNFFD